MKRGDAHPSVSDQPPNICLFLHAHPHGHICNSASAAPPPPAKMGCFWLLSSRTPVIRPVAFPCPIFVGLAQTAMRVSAAT